MMSRQLRPDLVKLLERLVEHPGLRLAAVAEDRYAIVGGETVADATQIAGGAVRWLRSNGILREAEPGRLAASPVTVAWLKRRAHPDLPFRNQHDTLEPAHLDDAIVQVNTQESPIAALARRAGKGGKPWLDQHAVAAAERLRRDFEIGGLQPRITANWSASVNSGRRAGDGAGLTDLTDMALAARIRFDRAMAAVGPELSGLLVDVCCFLKGLETVERERQWPSRSAKLVLRLALEALARHYGLKESATGTAAAGRVRHWGTQDYRPEVT